MFIVERYTSNFSFTAVIRGAEHPICFPLKDSLIKNPSWPISLQCPPVTLSCVGMKSLLAGPVGVYNSKLLPDLMVINGYCDTSAEKLNRAGSYQ